MLDQILNNISKPDEKLLIATQERLDSLTKPQGSLGRMEETAKKIVSITEKQNPLLKNKAIFTIAADHGIAEEGVSAFPQDVTKQMVYNFLEGGAAINVLAKHIGARVVIADFGVAGDLKIHPALKIKKIGHGTKNMSKGPAMTRDEAVRALEAGIELFNEEFQTGLDIIGIGEMGIGNTTSASAITAIFTGKSVNEVTSKGTGINHKRLTNKISLIEKAIKINSPNKEDPIDVLSKIGGFEIAGLAGIILAAASKKIPVVLDGFISGAAALVAFKIKPETREFMIASHLSTESGHKAVIDLLRLEPLFDLKLRLGEGSGAALGINLAEASIKILTQMATFKKANVSEKINS